MGGAILQLVSYGKQSEYLINNPCVSYFKYVHKKHTNFSIDSISNIFEDNLDFGKKAICKIGRYGDLISKMLLEISLPKLKMINGNGGWTNELGRTIINKVEFLIGGEVIDIIDGDWLDIYSEFFLDKNKKEGYHQMIKKSNIINGYTFNDKMTLYIPLHFWFCQHFGNSLPLISLQYHDVSVAVYLKDFKDCYFIDEPNMKVNQTSIIDGRIYCDYVFLDTKERKQFAEKEHKYLILQHQKNEKNIIRYGNNSKIINLEFNHPTKSIFWTLQNREAQKLNLWGNYGLNPQRMSTKKSIEPLLSAELKINGQERFSERKAEYFRLVQPYNYGLSIPEKYMYTYNFGIHSHEYQPGGTINFSRIDNSTLTLKFNMDSDVDLEDELDIKIMAINYNILKIKNGTGGLLFSD
mgnify:CR=1 FL=1|tara:strand:- start:3929 stop:5155 length:1227 start_codon:yes stop_codon:yes gene_type:complete